VKEATLALALTLAMATPAVAHNCPVLMGQFEEALGTSTADEATKTAASALYDTGKAAHQAGHHDASVAALEEALALIGP
jgi:hypothetical protein